MPAREEIIKSHPLLYREPLRFECLDGWLQLISDLSDELEALIKVEHQMYEAPAYYSCYRCKEKWGFLNYSMTSTTELMQLAIERAERMSRHICENCGKPGVIRNKTAYWIQTLCDGCIE